jgi:hypothetical protein
MFIFFVTSIPALGYRMCAGAGERSDHPHPSVARSIMRLTLPPFWFSDRKQKSHMRLALLVLNAHVGQVGVASSL